MMNLILHHLDHCQQGSATQACHSICTDWLKGKHYLIFLIPIHVGKAGLWWADALFRAISWQFKAAGLPRLHIKFGALERNSYQNRLVFVSFSFEWRQVFFINSLILFMLTFWLATSLTVAAVHYQSRIKGCGFTGWLESAFVSPVLLLLWPTMIPTEKEQGIIQLNRIRFYRRK